MFKNTTRNDYVKLVAETYAQLKGLDERIFLSMAVPFTAEPLGIFAQLNLRVFLKLFFG